MKNGIKLLENIKNTNDSLCKIKLRTEAINCFQKGLTVTHEMEKNVIAALRKIGIAVIISPYEADVQLAYLCYTNICQAVMTEDSDILVYSAVCGKSFPILYKFNKTTNTAQILELGKLINMDDSLDTITMNKTNTNTNSNNMEISMNTNQLQLSQSQIAQSQLSQTQTTTTTVTPIEDKNFINSLMNHFHGKSGRRMFVQMCILAGCDYKESIHGVGLITAQQVSNYIYVNAIYN